ncbi:unnamed protein product [Heterobilharzia americana]|nr:unnamed protein product [Heterobilharzia americana]
MRSTVRSVFRLLNLICLLICLFAFVSFAVIFWSKLATKSLEPTIRKLKVKMDLQKASTIDAVNRVVWEFTRPVTLPLMGIAILFMCNYAFGVLVALNRSSTFFLIYEIAVTACIISHIATLGLLFSNPSGIREMMESLLEKQIYAYESMTNLDGPGLFSAVVMIELKCCGFRDTTDFSNVKLSWKDEYDGRKYETVETPIPCCMMNDNLELIDKNCPHEYFSSHDKHHNQSCKEPFGQKAFSYVAIVAYASIVLILINCAIMVCVVLILRELWIHL